MQHSSASSIQNISYSQPQLLHNSPTLHRYGAFRKTEPKASCTYGRVQVYVRRCCTVVSCRSSRAHVAEKHKSGNIQHTLIHAACSHVTLPVRSSTLQSEPMADRRKLWSALLGKHILLAPLVNYIILESLLQPLAPTFFSDWGAPICCILSLLLAMFIYHSKQKYKTIPSWMG